MVCLENIRSFILRMDLFAAQPTLRTRGEADFQTLSCGCFSIILILTFIGIFATSFINVLTKVDITATENISDSPESTTTLNGIFFAISIQNVDLSQINEHFFFQLYSMTKEKGKAGQKENIQLEYCREEDWVNIDDNFKHYFQKFNMGSMLCPSHKTDLTIFGYEGADERNHLQLRVQSCKKDCANLNDTSDFFNNHLDQYDFFKVKLFFLNTVISPSLSTPVQRVLQRDIFLTFTQKSGSRGKLTLAPYNIQTDESILPFTVYQEQTGHYIQQKQTHTTQIRSTHYVVLEIYKSTLLFSVTRSHGKLDDMLSYVGGLFGLLFVFIAFFLSSYNEYRYELMIAEKAFALDEGGTRIKQKQFSFFTYIKYSIYDWLKMFGCEPDWEDMKLIDEAREETNEQLDVCLVTKKLLHLEKVVRFLTDENEYLMLQLMKPLTIRETKKMRKVLQYYDKVMDNVFVGKQKEEIHTILSSATIRNSLPIEEVRRKEREKDENKEKEEEIHPDKENPSFREIEQFNVEHENEFDSDDEETEKYIYQKYMQYFENRSERAVDLRGKVPEYLRMRMIWKKMGHQPSRFSSASKLTYIDINL